jgi:hypothetical protein
MNSVMVERGPMYVSNVARLSFGSIIFKDKNKSTLVRNPVNPSNVENPSFVLLPLRDMYRLMQEKIPTYQI